ncbi:MAG: hypothetical protein LBV22_03105 [Mycoplasmataceae bacterium]|nr:hypothetical protein [Mycoplasmataceae bacterium]
MKLNSILKSSCLSLGLLATLGATMMIAGCSKTYSLDEYLRTHAINLSDSSKKDFSDLQYNDTQITELISHNMSIQLIFNSKIFQLLRYSTDASAPLVQKLGDKFIKLKTSPFEDGSFAIQRLEITSSNSMTSSSKVPNVVDQTTTWTWEKNQLTLTHVDAIDSNQNSTFTTPFVGGFSTTVNNVTMNGIVTGEGGEWDEKYVLSIYDWTNIVFPRMQEDS